MLHNVKAQKGVMDATVKVYKGFVFAFGLADSAVQHDKRTTGAVRDLGKLITELIGAMKDNVIDRSEIVDHQLEGDISATLAIQKELAKPHPDVKALRAIYGAAEARSQKTFGQVTRLKEGYRLTSVIMNHVAETAQEAAIKDTPALKPVAEQVTKTIKQLSQDTTTNLRTIERARFGLPPEG